MKTKVLTLLGLAATISHLAVAGEFINLGFDDPDLSNARLFRPSVSPVGDPGGLYAPVEDVFRGWQVSFTGLDGAPYYGLVPVGAGTGPFALSPTGDPRLGAYTLYVNHGIYSTAPRLDFSLSQVGEIPSWASVLRLLDGGPDTTDIYINGARQVLSYPPGRRGVVDVAPFAGQQVELRFDFGVAKDCRFDVVGFEAIPEPSSYVLMAIGVGWLGWLGLNRRR